MLLSDMPCIWYHALNQQLLISKVGLFYQNASTFESSLRSTPFFLCIEHCSFFAFVCKTLFSAAGLLLLADNTLFTSEKTLGFINLRDICS